MSVRLQREANALAFAVHDTGRGFDQRAEPLGSGLTGVQDRIGSVGGRFEINGNPGHGATLTGAVPWPARAT